MNVRKKSIYFSGIIVVVSCFVLKLGVLSQTDDETPLLALLFCSRLLWGQIPITQWLCQCKRQGFISGAMGFCIFFLLFCLIHVLWHKPHRTIQDAVQQAWEEAGLARPRPSAAGSSLDLGLTQSQLEAPGIFLFIFASPQTRSLGAHLEICSSGCWKLESSYGRGDRALTKDPLERIDYAMPPSTPTPERAPRCGLGEFPSLQGLHAFQTGVRVKSAMCVLLALSAEVFSQRSGERADEGCFIPVL